MGSLFGADNDQEVTSNATTISAGISGEGNVAAVGGNRSIGTGADNVFQRVSLGRDASLTINTLDGDTIAMAHNLAVTGFNAAGTVAMAGIDAANRGAALATAGVNAGTAIALNANQNLRDIGGLALATGVEYAQVQRDIFSDAASALAEGQRGSNDVAILALTAGQNNVNSVLNFTAGTVDRYATMSTQLTTQSINAAQVVATNALQSMLSNNNQFAALADRAVQAAQTTALNATPVSEGAYAQTQSKEFNKLAILLVLGVVAVYLIKSKNT